MQILSIVFALCIIDLAKSASFVVFASEDDYAGAPLWPPLVSSLLNAPLIFSDNLNDEEITSLLSRHSETTTSLGISLEGSLELPMEFIAPDDTEAVIDWLADQAILPEYLAVTESQ